MHVLVPPFILLMLLSKPLLGLIFTVAEEPLFANKRTAKVAETCYLPDCLR